MSRHARCVTQHAWIGCLVVLLLAAAVEAQCPCQKTCAQPDVIAIQAPGMTTCRGYSLNPNAFAPTWNAQKPILCSTRCVPGNEVPTGNQISIWNVPCAGACTAAGCNVVGDPTVNVEEANFFFGPAAVILQGVAQKKCAVDPEI